MTPTNKFFWLVVPLVLYLGMVSMVYRFKNPKLTETEILLCFPRMAIWKECSNEGMYK